MTTGLNLVLDIGKTLSKLSAWTADGVLVERRTRANRRLVSGDYLALDAAGIEAWIAETLSDFAQLGRIESLIPVAHGAGAVLIKDGALVLPPLDYEATPPAEIMAEYRAQRDPFAQTGSPELPDGLNLGAQLHWLEALHPQAFAGATILPWAQYWAWLLSGVAASEVTSLGCHTDLWRPSETRFSDMAIRRGWAEKIAPVRRAADVLGALTPAWVARTGLSEDIKIHCGLHDSNAALLAARGFAEIADHEATVLSTGTWFVAMRTPTEPFVTVPEHESRDCLVNVDAFGKSIPSARFMGGREIESLIGLDARRVDIKPDQPALLAAVPSLVADGTMLLPTFAPGFGPFPIAQGQWVNETQDWIARRAAVCLYAALVVNTSLDLIASKGLILIEGRFAEAEVFVRALASLRPNDKIYTSNVHNDVSYGALRLLNPSLKPSAALVRVKPLDTPLAAYVAQWQTYVAQQGVSQ